MKQSDVIAVTGANGLAGSAAIAHFRARGFQNVTPITRQDVDLRYHGDTMRLFRKLSPDYVFHAAATVYGLQGNMDNQYKSILDNTMINTNVIDASRHVGAKKIVAMGTNAVYPWPAVLPYRAETIFDGPPHDGEYGYAHAKRHMLAMLETSGIPYTYLVSGNLYGPRDTFNVTTGHVLPSLIKKFYDASIGATASVNIWGDGSAERDFLHSADLADLVSFFFGNAITGPINIGEGVTRPLSYVAKLLSSISGVDYSRVVYDTSKPLGRPTTYSDLKVLHGLGWRPSIRFDHGLKSTYEWYASSRRAAY